MRTLRSPFRQRGKCYSILRRGTRRGPADRGCRHRRCRDCQNQAIRHRRAESDQRCLDARGQVRSWVSKQRKLRAYSRNRASVWRTFGADRYGRHLGTCSIDGEDVGRWLVRNGWALAFRRYSTAYVADEDYAREHQAGLWTGAFIAPWDWRHRGTQTIILGAYQVPTTAQRDLLSPDVAGTPPSPNCVIKANLKSQASASTTCRAAISTIG